MPVVKHTSVLRSKRYKEITWSTTFWQSWFWPLSGHLCWSLLVKMLLVTCFLNQPSLSNTTICTENVYTTNVDMRIGEYLHYWKEAIERIGYSKNIYILYRLHFQQLGSVFVVFLPLNKSCNVGYERFSLLRKNCVSKHILQSFSTTCTSTRYIETMTAERQIKRVDIQRRLIFIHIIFLQMRGGDPRHKRTFVCITFSATVVLSASAWVACAYQESCSNR